MSGSVIIRYVNPWKFRRDQNAQRMKALRQRDGDNCRRCKRPIRFDLTDGHDLGPKVEPIEYTAAAGEEQALENLCLTHGRCNSAGADHTGEVSERIRRRSEAEMLSKSRTKKPRRAA